MLSLEREREREKARISTLMAKKSINPKILQTTDIPYPL